MSGHGCRGEVEAVGRNVTRFQPGDAVFGGATAPSPSTRALGEDRLAPKPANLTFEQAAAIPRPRCTALQGLRDKGQVQPGQKVLINGAAGGVGTFAVQIAKAFGAEVTGVCSTRNVDLVRSIGADHVIDYTQDDFTRSGQRYDLILDTAGTVRCPTAGAPSPPRDSRHRRRRRRRPMDRGPGSLDSGARAVTVREPEAAPVPREVEQRGPDVLKDLIEAGKVTPVIDRTYPLSEVPDAIRYLEEGHARGKVVITV